MKIQAYDISRQASAATLIFDAIRQAILNGDLTQGEPLRQEDIARAFNVSRVPVREALLKLEQHGLITSQRYKGAVVAGLSLEEANEIFEFRALLEPEIIRRAVPHMSPEIMEAAANCCEAFGRADDPMQWGDLNRRFHKTLYAPSGLAYHMEMLDKAMDRIDPYLRAQLLLSEGMQRANREHLMIVDACKSGKADTAADLTRQHILGAQESLSRYWKK